MYGHGTVPPSRSEGTVITLRVLFAAIGLLSCGLLACVPLFRIAVQRGRWFDWTVAWVSLPLSIAALAVVGSVPKNDTRGDVATALVLVLGAAAVAYFLTVDIQMHRQWRLSGGHVAPHAPTVHAPYGHPQPPHPSPYTTAPVQQPPLPPHHHHTPVPQQPPAQGVVPPAPVPPPPAQPPAPARIDQVRAELDELSAYLRRNEGDPDGGHGHGRGPGGAR
ncbi:MULTISPECIES: hypothetical protein [unclassified Streptomyces]|uniref:hypothetical protein n=1 Tax=unclassified Streptomyces TaxID=2593676 RepID=UPI001F0360B8|nr:MULTISPECIES: hypothetical protein [unclassified Streptomyces]MCH0564322.1 hypothetical protein [Streptomyces sp. MUM 2J]MCH0569493.1 hypothetical protein [Streptomyces sp. MUM 136J]